MHRRSDIVDDIQRIVGVESCGGRVIIFDRDSLGFMTTRMAPAINYYFRRRRHNATPVQSTVAQRWVAAWR
jgi:hypothetical protein